MSQPDPAPVRNKLSISPGRVAGVMSAGVVFLMLMHVAVMYANFILGRDHVFGLVRLFDVVAEADLPNWYSSMMLLGCVALLGVVARTKALQRDRFRWHWLGLALVFVLLSLDEAAMIHEAVQVLLRRRIEHDRPVFALASIAYTSAPALVVFIATLGFLPALPGRTATMFLTAGALFVAGGIGVDYAGELHKIAHGSETFTCALVSGLEEALEMSAVALFVYVLLDFLKDPSAQVTFVLP